MRASRRLGSKSVELKLPAAPGAERYRLNFLIGAAVLTLMLWHVPFGNYILYPFSILSTWFHEMSHGVTAMLLGGHLSELQIFSDGSGVAHWEGRNVLGGLGEALVAAAGPMGPPIIGSVMILLSTRTRAARASLLALGLALLISDVVWVRTLFGFAMVAVLGLGILWMGLRSPRNVQLFTLQFLGVQACISAYQHVDYLFMSSAVIGGQVLDSDCGLIAHHLLLPYWFWGGLMGVLSLGLAAGSLWMAFRRPSIRRKR